MGSTRYEHHTIHHQNFHQKTIYLPMFCRLSIKDIKVNNHYKDRTSVDEPSSPKVSCIGQVKRSNRVIGFPAAAATPTATTNHQKYTKLKKLFSSKTLLPTTNNTSNSGARCGSRSCRFVSNTNGAPRCVNINSRRLKFRNDGDQQDYVKVVNISELDPPLPVVKRAAAAPGVGRDEVNIWKRRFNGVTLESLQIEQIRSPNNKFQTPPTV